MNNSRVSVINDLQSSHSIVMNQTQALCEVLRTYFENGIDGSRTIDLSDSTLTSFLYQVDDNLERMEEIMDKIVKEAYKEPVKLRLAAG